MWRCCWKRPSGSRVQRRVLQKRRRQRRRSADLHRLTTNSPRRRGVTEKGKRKVVLSRGNGHGFGRQRAIGCSHRAVTAVTEVPENTELDRGPRSNTDSLFRVRRCLSDQSIKIPITFLPDGASARCPAIIPHFFCFSPCLSDSVVRFCFWLRLRCVAPMGGGFSTVRRSPGFHSARPAFAGCSPGLRGRRWRRGSEAVSRDAGGPFRRPGATR
jgi:hypothetical protein